MDMIKYGTAVVLGGTVLYANLPTRFTLGNVVPTVEYLGETELRKVINEDNFEAPIKASELFAKGPTLVMTIRRPGCLFCRVGASDMTQIMPDLQKAGVRLIGVTHQTNAVEQFLPYFNGELYIDPQKRFFGPNERWMPFWMGALRPFTYINALLGMIRGIKAGPLLDGEGRLLGGGHNRLFYLLLSVSHSFLT
ncbi:unnamed protein product [Anisakis simplex]|uniref:Peroxiredoxin-like 2A n=1 Tax=Anisakis simplex TaxID=6269 RepID=A0A0M3JZ90_ANISI|nr:unnamed protein product [Anisakis simplex]